MSSSVLKPPGTHRAVRSFVLRAGRTTAGQERALVELWPKYGVEVSPDFVDLDALFGRRAPRCLEIGFGAGEVIASLAQAHPEIDYIGIEVHRPGVGRLLLAAEMGVMKNLRVFCHDAVEVLERRIADAALHEILVFFPDPWHKKRHHKRRLVQPGFVALLARKLASHGVLRLATDWQAYAEQMREVCDACSTLVCLDPRGFTDRPAFRPPTRFEKRGERLGHGVWDLAYRKQLAE
jgi:tRNA (guanine-N7-)-methyltransferase